MSASSRRHPLRRDASTDGLEPRRSLGLYSNMPPASTSTVTSNGSFQPRPSSQLSSNYDRKGPQVYGPGMLVSSGFMPSSPTFSHGHPSLSPSHSRGSDFGRPSIDLTRAVPEARPVLYPSSYRGPYPTNANSTNSPSSHHPLRHSIGTPSAVNFESNWDHRSSTEIPRYNYSGHTRYAPGSAPSPSATLQSQSPLPLQSPLPNNITVTSRTAAGTSTNNLSINAQHRMDNHGHQPIHSSQQRSSLQATNGIYGWHSGASFEQPANTLSSPAPSYLPSATSSTSAPSIVKVAPPPPIDHNSPSTTISPPSSGIDAPPSAAQTVMTVTRSGPTEDVDHGVITTTTTTTSSPPGPSPSAPRRCSPMMSLIIRAKLVLQEIPDYNEPAPRITIAKTSQRTLQKSSLKKSKTLSTSFSTRVVLNDSTAINDLKKRTLTIRFSDVVKVRDFDLLSGITESSGRDRTIQLEPVLEVASLSSVSFEILPAEGLAETTQIKSERVPHDLMSRTIRATIDGGVSVQATLPSINLSNRIEDHDQEGYKRLACVPSPPEAPMHHLVEDDLIEIEEVFVQPLTPDDRNDHRINHSITATSSRQSPTDSRHPSATASESIAVVADPFGVQTDAMSSSVTSYGLEVQSEDDEEYEYETIGFTTHSPRRRSSSMVTSPSEDHPVHHPSADQTTSPVSYSGSIGRFISSSPARSNSCWPSASEGQRGARVSSPSRALHMKAPDEWDNPSPSVSSPSMSNHVTPSLMTLLPSSPHRKFVLSPVQEPLLNPSEGYLVTPHSGQSDTESSTNELRDRHSPPPRFVSPSPISVDRPSSSRSVNVATSSGTISSPIHYPQPVRVRRPTLPEMTRSYNREIVYLNSPNFPITTTTAAAASTHGGGDRDLPQRTATIDGLHGSVHVADGADDDSRYHKIRSIADHHHHHHHHAEVAARGYSATLISPPASPSAAGTPSDSTPTSFVISNSFDLHYATSYAGRSGSTHSLLAGQRFDHKRGTTSPVGMPGIGPSIGVEDSSLSFEGGSNRQSEPTSSTALHTKKRKARDLRSSAYAPVYAERKREKVLKIVKTLSGSTG